MASKEKASTLYLAILRGELNTVKEFVRGGVSLNGPIRPERSGGVRHSDLDDAPALHFAIDQKKNAIAKFLIQNGADLNWKTKDRQRTPLMLAADMGNLDVFQALIAAGADIHAVDENGWTALDHAAAFDGSTAGPMVEAAIKAGAEPNRLSATWGSPLIKACWRGHAAACSALIANGADVNLPTEFGTPLLMALGRKGKDIIAALLEGGADPHLRYIRNEAGRSNKEYIGKTPLEFAQEQKLTKAVALFQNPVAAKMTPAKLTGGDVPALWKRLEAALSKVNPDYSNSLAKPADARQLTEFETRTGISLPDDVKASYLIHNGQEEDGDGIYVPESRLDGAYSLMSLEQMISEWNMWKQLVDGGEFRGQESTPDDGIRSDWWNPGWIPIMTNGGGDSLCVDVAPAEKGFVGQIIMMSHESPRRSLLARSWAELLSMLIDYWEERSKEC